jgi:hypothetical protein
MMLERIELGIELKVRSPFLFQGLANALMGLDATQLRDEEGKPLIPADQVRGVLKEAMCDIASVAPDAVTPEEILSLFGAGSEKADDAVPRDDFEHDRPSRSQLIFSDLTATDSPRDAGETTRVEIDLETGAAKTGHLQIIERVAPMGQVVTFIGTIVAFCPINGGQRVATALNSALNTVTSIGAFKSPGFGEIASAKIFPKTTAPLLPPTATAAQERAQFIVTFDRPILVDADWIADNAMLGAAIVPGAVFKGALAELLKRSGISPETDKVVAGPLAALRISHAVPVNDTVEPTMRPLPLSLISVKDGDAYNFGDALQVPEGNGAMIKGKAGVFLTDWKSDAFSLAAQKLGYASSDEPAKLPRTHTAIGPGGVANDQQLFTTIARSVRGRQWLVTVDGSKALVDQLAAGLDGVGKTSATATLRKVAQPATIQPQPVHGTTDQFAIVLQTPALMLDPKGDTNVGAQYALYFRTVCPEAKLLNFYAAQRLAGRYLATRRRPYGASTYYPFIMTDSGAVFLLQAEAGKAVSLRERLAKLMRTGLPVVTLKGAAPLDWRNCPFVPENGFGEIRADHLSAPNDLWRAVTNG